MAMIRGILPLIALGAVAQPIAQPSRPSPFTADRRIQAYQKMTARQPDSLHAQNLLASAFVLKMRETTDPAYLTRADKLLNRVLAREPGNYEALRLKTEVALENHNFREAAASSRAATSLAWASGPYVLMNWASLSVYVIIDGMTRGAYTGHRLDEFVNANRQDFRNARRVVNGLDQADKIAQQARDWLDRIT